MRLALLGNLGLGETVLVVLLAVLVFGRRLPEVVVQGLRALHKVKRSLEDLRRETGVDAELRQVRRTLEQVEREARVEDPLRLPGPAAFTRARSAPAQTAAATPPGTVETPAGEADAPPAETEATPPAESAAAEPPQRSA